MSDFDHRSLRGDRLKCHIVQSRIHFNTELQTTVVEKLPTSLSVRFQCKIVRRNLVIFSHVDIRFEKNGFEEQTMVYMRKSCLSPNNKAREIAFVPAIFSVIRSITNFAPRLTVPVNVHALSTPISVLFLGGRVHRSNQVLAVIWSSFHLNSMDVEVVLHLRIFFVSRVEIGSFVGTRFFLFLGAKERVNK